ncbi:MAG: hypothetical protein AAFV29_11730, partial [Myxococcota bacterium]
MIDAIERSGLKGEDAFKALLLLTVAALENNFSNRAGAPEQLREGTTGLFNLPEQNSMGRLSANERNNVSTALRGLLDKDRSGSLAQLLSGSNAGLGDLSRQLKIATNNRAKMGEGVDFLAKTGSMSPANIQQLRGIVAADNTLNDQSWDVASFSTNPSKTYNYWANEYSPPKSMGFNGWRARRQGWHNGLDLMG